MPLRNRARLQPCRMTRVMAPNPFMNLRLIAVLLVATTLSLGQATTTQSQAPTPPLPRTVDEAVTVLKTHWLSEKDRAWILGNAEEDVVLRLYRPFGTGVRNAFGLWGRNPELLASCGTEDPEACSVVILKRLWRSIRRDADPAFVRNLDCQLRMIEVILINPTDFSKLRMGEILKRTQEQIDRQQLARASVLVPVRDDASPSGSGQARPKVLGRR